jgi:hypothetical protein
MSVRPMAINKSLRWNGGGSSCNMQSVSRNVKTINQHTNTLMASRPNFAKCWVGKNLNDNHVVTTCLSFYSSFMSTPLPVNTVFLGQRNPCMSLCMMLWISNSTELNPSWKATVWFIQVNATDIVTVITTGGYDDVQEDGWIISKLILGREVIRRSQWLRGLRHELSSFFRTLGSWFESHSRHGRLCAFILCFCCSVYRQRPCDTLIPRPRSPTDCV